MNTLVFDNIIFYIQSAGGISTYWYELTKRIIEKNEFDIVNMVPNKNKPNNIYYHFLQKIWTNLSSENLNPKLATFLNCKVDMNTKFIFHSSYNRISRSSQAINVVTIHDLIPELFFKGWRKYFHKLRRLYFLKKADAIVCVSENTKKDVLNIYSFCKNLPIEVIYNGIADEFYQINTIKSRRKKILFVGRRPLYKNFKFAVDVMKNLPEYQLIIVGSKLEKDELTMLQGINYECHSNISNSKLNQLYNDSLCLLYPSSYEGFGIPVVEAMKAGCIVIGLNQGAVAEIANNECAILIDDLDVSKFKSAINSLESIELREKIVENGLKNAKKFNWDDSAMRLSNFYTSLINK